ncbi:hypothetical protein DVJ77_18290 [Dyella tabacisoli]|uniref:Uncharacterized protein n=2 Tax=Dyella tabacisoli TaxID=2282381 RepID=A0A369UJF3_9GAMM|nr:hypothetical protein DVJ77_18290 [Dyella tabacisoli]
MATADIVNGLPDGTDRRAAERVLRAIGESYGLKPEILRLDDPFSALGAIDSWSLGRGQEALEKWLKDNGVLHLKSPPRTIRDLITFVLSS